MNHPLSAFLDRAECADFDPGSFDCATLAADWIRYATGVDPLGAHRGRWSTLAEAYLRAGRAGGVSALARRCAHRANLVETSDPATGDVGLIEADRRAVFAIYLDPFWWGVAAVRGLSCMRASASIVWSVPFVDHLDRSSLMPDWPVGGPIGLTDLEAAGLKEAARW